MTCSQIPQIPQILNRLQNWNRHLSVPSLNYRRKRKHCIQELMNRIKSSILHNSVEEMKRTRTPIRFPFQHQSSSANEPSFFWFSTMSSVHALLSFTSFFWFPWFPWFLFSIYGMGNVTFDFFQIVQFIEMEFLISHLPLLSIPFHHNQFAAQWNPDRFLSGGHKNNGASGIRPAQKWSYFNNTLEVEVESLNLILLSKAPNLPTMQCRMKRKEVSSPRQSPSPRFV